MIFYHFVLNSSMSSDNDQYELLHQDNDDNPFFKCNIKELDYDTDEDDDNSKIRILIFWDYQINYDWFSIKKHKVLFKKDIDFFNNLSELKEIRNINKNQLNTGKIFKLDNVLSNEFNFYVYFIIFYDNTKIDIELYGIFNQLIDETKLINNIVSENIYGTKGLINNNLSNLDSNDFIIKYFKF